MGPGDAVIADLSAHGFGGFAEFVCVPETVPVHKPGRWEPTACSTTRRRTSPGSATATT